MIRFAMVIPVVGLFLMAILVGCRMASPPANFYVLQPLEREHVTRSITDDRNMSTIGVQQVELPGYLNRVQMVKRTGPNQLDVSSRHRWADYPDRMIQRVLGDNLQILMADARVYSAPWPAGFKPDVTVDVTFLELIGTTDKKMLLSATWTIIGNGDPSPPHRTSLSETISGAGFDDLAAAHSRALESLSRDVAESLRVFVE